MIQPLAHRVTDCYREASPEFIQQGERWYQEAHAIARVHATVYDVTLETASGVIAALSPQVGWGQNIRLAERMLESGGTMDHGALGRNLAWARAICDGTPALDVLNGPKTRAFYQAIVTAGESETPVIDRHAWDMMLGVRNARPPRPKQYVEAAEMMKSAAFILGKNVHHVQATTWLTWRARFHKPGTFDLHTQPTLDFSSIEH